MTCSGKNSTVEQYALVASGIEGSFAAKVEKRFVAVADSAGHVLGTGLGEVYSRFVQLG